VGGRIGTSNDNVVWVVSLLEIITSTVRGSNSGDLGVQCSFLLRSCSVCGDGCVVGDEVASGYRFGIPSKRLDRSEAIWNLHGVRHDD